MIHNQDQLQKKNKRNLYGFQVLVLDLSMNKSSFKLVNKLYKIVTYVVNRLNIFVAKIQLECQDISGYHL